MSAAPHILAVIPARGGSKGVPLKNLRPLGGRPLIAHTVDVALELVRLGRIARAIVSTDDEEIRQVVRNLGADAPFLRPADLADDRTPMVPVLRHAVTEIEAVDGVAFDWVLLLQPTAPFRTADDVGHAIAAAETGGCDSVISVVRVFASHPILMKRIEGDQLLPFMIEEPEGTRRQDYEPAAYMRNGAIYMTRRKALMEHGSIWGERIRPYVMPEERSHNIDSEIDLLVAEALLERGALQSR